MSDILTTNKYVRFMRGSQEAYDALVSKDDNTLYFVYDPANIKAGALYMGNRLISGGDTILQSATLKELADVLAEEVKENSILVQNADGYWDNMSVKDVADLIRANMDGIAAQVFQTEPKTGENHQAAIARVTEGKNVIAGDIAIVKEPIAIDNDDGSIATSHTSYVYDGSNWAAMDGNYSAKNVFFDQDFTFTKNIGTVTIPASGSTTMKAKGKNLSEFFSSLFAQENLKPTKTDPSVSLTISGGGAFEVGTTATPTYKATFEDGTYQYGPEPTGATVTEWSITSNNSDSYSLASGSLKDIYVTESTALNVTATAKYDDGDYAKTNLGNNSTVKITAGSKYKTVSNAVTGYRNSFYGVLNDKTTELDSAVIRNLTKSGKTLKAGDTFTIDVNKNALRTILAVPANITPSYVGHREGLNAPLLDENTTKYTVSVSGATAGADMINYNVYVWTYAEPYAANEHYDVTI